jgi:hypothetical protein
MGRDFVKECNELLAAKNKEIQRLQDWGNQMCKLVEIQVDLLQSDLLTQKKLEIWIGELVQAQNQLHGIRHTKMAKDTICYVEKEMLKCLKEIDHP